MKTFLTLMAAVLLASPQVNAKPKKKSALDLDQQKEISLQIPASELNLEEVMEGEPVSNSTVEISVSTLAPSSFSRPTYSSGHQKFQSSSLPALSLNRLADFFDLEFARSRMGLMVMGLTRSVDVARTGGVFKSTQDLYFISARLGVDFNTPRFAAGVLQASLGLALLPTYAFASRSQLEENVSETGFPVEISAGVEARPEFLRQGFLGFQGAAFGLGAQYVAGKVGSANFEGFGGQGFFRIDL